jgi:hypothetical protein
VYTAEYPWRQHKLVGLQHARIQPLTQVPQQAVHHGQLRLQPFRSFSFGVRQDTPQLEPKNFGQPLSRLVWIQISYIAYVRSRAFQRPRNCVREDQIVKPVG